MPRLTSEQNELGNLAMGRLLRILFNDPTRPGANSPEVDARDYDACRSFLLDLAAPVEIIPASQPLAGWNFGSGSAGRVE